MASGLPDYKRGIDLALQSLAELIIRPKNGAAQLLAADVEVTASDKTPIGSFGGKGMIYGGLLYFTSTSTQDGSIPILSIDGVEITDLNFWDLKQFGADVENAYPFYVRRYDDANFIYCVGISGGITFETGFELLYDEKKGKTPTVYCKVLFALI